MIKSKSTFTVTYGGWYQRTTLHLSEIYDLLARGKSDLPLSTTKLTAFHQAFDFTSVTREAQDFEYIKATTSSGIEVRYYEDGLYILTLQSANIAAAEISLRRYFDEILHPAISYIFSLGAPTPKVLAAIKTSHPIVISAYSKSPLLKGDLEGFKLGETYSQIKSKNYSVYKTPQYIIIFGHSPKVHLTELVEMQIFFREFKDQLQRYLNLHRQIWEEISEIKERGAVVGAQVEPLRQRLDSYEKTINLIKSRLGQMSSYVRTRSSLAQKLSLDSDLKSLFQYKYETLIDTHSYIQEIWNMTHDYVVTAIQVINEVKSKSSNNSINSLRLITTIGVLASIFTYLSKDTFPKITLVGFWYFIVLILGTWIVNQVITVVFQKLKYQLKFSETAIKK